MVVKKVTWPQEVVYSNQGKPAVYEELSFLFVKGYRITMKGEEGATKDKMAMHLEELMQDSELHGWIKVRAYHSIWLNQIEQGKASWLEDRAKLAFCRALIWPQPPQMR